MQLYLVYTHRRSWLGGKIFTLCKVGTSTGVKDVLIELDDTTHSCTGGLAFGVTKADLSKFIEIDIHHPACVEYIKGKKKHQPIRFYHPIDSARMREELKRAETVKFFGAFVVPTVCMAIVFLIMLYYVK